MRKYKERMTDAQLAILAQVTPEAALAKFKEYIDLANEAEAAIVRLPHTSERGFGVVHSCNMDMDFIAGRYRLIAEQYKWLLYTDADLAEAREYEVKK